MSDANENGPKVIGAAVLVLAGYALVNLEKTTQAIQGLTGGGINWTASGTHTISWGEGTGAYSLETYWSSGSLYYRAACKMSPEQLRQAVTRSKSPTYGRAGMDFRLRNRFGQDLIHLEIPAEAFKTDDKDSNRVVAVGSAEVSEADYWEIVHSAGECGGLNFLAN